MPIYQTLVNHSIDLHSTNSSAFGRKLLLQIGFEKLDYPITFSTIPQLTCS